MVDMKHCYKCCNYKTFNDFYRDITRKDKFSNMCKDCSKIRNKVYNKENSIKINKQHKLKYKLYPEKRIIVGIKQRCNNKNNPKYKYYGGRGIKNYLTEVDIKFLMERDNFLALKDPTIDRIDNDGHYELSNCRFIERNKNKAVSKIKKIKQLDKNNNVIKIWDSITEIEKTLKFPGGNISKGIKFNKIRYGYFWEKIYD